MAHSVAECWFLDVGQGMSNIILLGDGRAIVIDCGPRGCNVPLLFLKRYVSVIEHLILCHNDADHAGGAAGIIQAYPRAIRNIRFLSDRPSGYLRVFQLLKHERRAGNLLCEPERLEVSEKPQCVFSDVSSGIELHLLYPTFTESLEAQSAGTRRANATCGVLALFCGRRSVVFSGDATIEAWEALASRLSGKLPLQCDVVAVPHHGGHLLPTEIGETEDERGGREETFLRRLYSKILHPRYAVISVGTNNQFGHPIPATITTISSLGVRVLCTEMTPHCSSDLESVRPGLVTPAPPSRSTRQVRTSRAGRSKDVGCCGSIIAEIGAEKVAISRWSEHQIALDNAVDAGTVRPLCRVS